MKTSLSRLADSSAPLVLDASPIINLLGTGQIHAVLRLLDHPTFAEETVLREVTRDPLTGESPERTLTEMNGTGVLKPAKMAGATYAAFIRLTSATPPDDLGDGEAATIAYAAEVQGVAVLDDAKAIRVVAERYPRLPVLTTLDILCCRQILSAFAKEQLAALVFSALVRARMRVPPRYRDWVVDLIGAERARDCPSLRLLRRL